MRLDIRARLSWSIALCAVVIAATMRAWAVDRRPTASGNLRLRRSRSAANSTMRTPLDSPLAPI